MKRYLKEIIILILQLFMFYIFPLFAGPTDAIAMVFLIILATLVLSIIIGSISKEKIKYLYPIMVAILFIPSIFIYYNESALIHSVWYLVISTVGLSVGIIIYKLTNKVNLVKKALIVIGIIMGIILLDSIQAIVFDNNPIFKIRDYYNGGQLQYKDKGFLVDTYCGVNGRKDTVIKGYSYSLSYDGDFKIIDTSKKMEDVSFDTALEEIYEDEKYTYYLPCMKSQYIKVEFGNGKKYNIIPALQNGYINIEDLDKFDIYYIKKEKYNS